MYYKKSKTNPLLAHKEFALSSVFILTCLTLSLIFPSEGLFQDLSKNVFFLIILPILYLKFILGESLKKFGLNLDNKKIGLLWGGGMLVFSLIITYFLINYSSFGENYTILAYIKENFWFFLLYELVLVNLYVFTNEFFFRGIVLFTLRKKFPSFAIPVQFFLFILMLLVAKSLSWQLLPMILLSLTGAVVSYKSRSFIYSYIMGLLYIIILDAYIIYTLK